MPGSAYAELLAHTVATIDERARLHRDFVILIGLLFLMTAAWAVVTTSLRPLAMLGITPLLVALHLWRDARAVERWRAAVVDTWADDGMDLGPYVAAIRANKALPAQTLDSMLATLPPASLDAPTRRAPVLRDLLRTAAGFIAARTRDHAFIVGLARSVGVLAAVAAVAAASLQPLMLLVAAPLLLLTEIAIEARRLRRWQRRTADARAAGLDGARLRSLLDQLQFDALPARLQSGILGALD